MERKPTVIETMYLLQEGAVSVHASFWHVLVDVPHSVQFSAHAYSADVVDPVVDTDTLPETGAVSAGHVAVHQIRLIRNEKFPEIGITDVDEYARDCYIEAS